MNFIEQLTAVALLVDFFLGVSFGVVGGAAYGSRLEDRESSLLGAEPDAVSAGARAIYGLYTRDDGYMASLLPGGHQVPVADGDERRGYDLGTQEEDLER
jgi:hypothetical protein